MSLAVGKSEYNIGIAPVTAHGLSLTSDELNAAVAGPVAEIVFDDSGKADVTTLLESVPDTEFDQSEIKRILNHQQKPEDWRVGEALAESYLIHHRACNFPWPDGRDERKLGSSLPGADLVGFQRHSESERFAFGEVKTSGEEKYPPGAMHGRTGLKQQLEDLRDKVSIRDGLVLYLWYRAVNAPWKNRFISAFKRYNTDHTDVQLFGLLIRNVTPHPDDLQVRVFKLERDSPGIMSIELLAIYLPLRNINKLSEKVMHSRKGGNT